jgi:hypothetical protein
MIDCLLTDLSTASELRVYIVIRITQISLVIEMKTILIYSYCMRNALLSDQLNYPSLHASLMGWSMR